MSSPAPHTRHGIFILLRRLRLPLSMLILVYAVVVLGFTLIEGVDPQGRPWRMSFLHAFYFVSFLGTTIGLGEIPHPFSDAQRLWATGAIYSTVIAWLYAIGALFAVLQDPVFRRVVREGALERSVRRLREPFYLVCGYDDAGHRVARELADDGIRLVVVDVDPTRVDQVDVDNLAFVIPALAGDASDPQALALAGLTHPCCAGVLALTGSDQINTKIALTARILAPNLPVLCAARDHAWHARMAAAGADHIINPLDTFAERVALSIRTPSLHVIYEALTSQTGTAMDEPPRFPEGRWLLCGSDLFSRALRRQLQALNIEVTVVDPALDAAQTAPSPSKDQNQDQEEPAEVAGDPTDPAVLRRATVEEAAVLVAGTTIDIDNLTITLAARALNKRMFIVARQTQRRNSAVFQASPADLVTFSGHVVAAEVLRRLRAPLLSAFLRRSRDEDEPWAQTLLEQLRVVVGSDVLETWAIRIEPTESPTVCTALAAGQTVTLARLMTRTDGSTDRVRAVPLLLQRDRERQLRPMDSLQVQLGDEVLFCGNARARAVMRHTVAAHALALLDPTTTEIAPPPATRQ